MPPSKYIPDLASATRGSVAVYESGNCANTFVFTTAGKRRQQQGEQADA
ncbi:hypothetical protein [Paenibacillus campi]|nr:MULTISPECIES: hypothetical protein [unclassified Paenibacillus]